MTWTPSLEVDGDLGSVTVPCWRFPRSELLSLAPRQAVTQVSSSAACSLLQLGFPTAVTCRGEEPQAPAAFWVLPGGSDKPLGAEQLCRLRLAQEPGRTFCILAGDARGLFG